VLKCRNPSLRLAAIRSPHGTQFVEFGVRGLGTTVTLGFGCLPFGLPQESYDGPEPIDAYRPAPAAT